MKSLTRIIFGLSLISLSALFLYTVVSGYTSAINELASFLNVLQQKDKFFRLVSPGKYHLIQATLLVAIVLNLFLLLRFSFFFDATRSFLKEASGTLKRILVEGFHSELKWFLLFPFCLSVYYACTLPVSYDEAWTYLNFSSKGILSSMSYYPAPNNHILHSIATALAVHLPIISPLLKIRIPTLIANLLTWFIAFDFLKRLLNKNAALVIVAVSSMLFMTLYYSVMSRGYALVTLFFVIACYAAFSIAGGKSERRHWICYCIASVLGFYTMPSFLYPFLSLNIFIAIHARGNFLKLVKWDALIAIGVIVLYTPVVILNGPGAIISNSAVKPIPRSEAFAKLPRFFSDTVNNIFGIKPVYIVILLIISLLLLLFRKTNRITIAFVLIFLFTPFIFLLIHSVIPFPRTFCYYSVVFLLMFSLPWTGQLQKIKINYFVAGLLIVQSALAFNFANNIRTDERFSIHAGTVAQNIAGNRTYLCNDDYLGTILLFNLQSNGFTNYEMKYCTTVEISADTINTGDFILLNTNMDRTVHRKPKFVTETCLVY